MIFKFIFTLKQEKKITQIAGSKSKEEIFFDFFLFNRNTLKINRQ